MNKGKIFIGILGLIVMIFGIIWFVGSVSKLNSDLTTINENQKICQDLQTKLDSNAEQLNNLPDDFPALKNSIIEEHNRQVAQYEEMC